MCNLHPLKTIGWYNMLVQIEEPKKRIAIGIDLGTTHTLVALYNHTSKQACVLGDTPLLPSVVHYAPNHQTLVGQDALPHLLSDPENTIASAKRFMGRNFADIRFSHPYNLVDNHTNMVAFCTRHGNVSPVAVSAKILQTIKKQAIDTLGNHYIIDGAVITVPAYFDDAQRQATLDAAHAVNLPVLRLVNEPTAAAIAYGLDNHDDEKAVLVYDLGGGTFDVSVLLWKDGVFSVLATGGNSALGGDDIDRLIVRDFCTKLGVDMTTLSAKNRAYLQNKARHTKEQLSTTPSIMLNLEIDGVHYQGVFDETMLRTIAKPAIERTLQIAHSVAHEASYAIDTVILVGGSSKMPIVAQAVAQSFDKTPLCSLNPDHVVALGASIIADKLHRQDSNTILMDVTPLSLGLETMGGLVEVIIPKNTPIPVQKSQFFTTHKDNQTGLVIHVVQGERELVKDCRSLGTFVLNGLSPKLAGLVRAQVTFSVDENGQLSVSASELDADGNAKQSIQVQMQAHSGLSDADKQALINAGTAHAQQDKAMRAHIENTLRAQKELDALNLALNHHAHLLSDGEREALMQAMDATAKALTLPPPVSDSTPTKGAVMMANPALLDPLGKAMRTLKPLSDTFAERIMNIATTNALAGKRTDEL